MTASDLEALRSTQIGSFGVSFQPLSLLFRHIINTDRLEATIRHALMKIVTWRALREFVASQRHATSNLVEATWRALRMLKGLE